MSGSNSSGSNCSDPYFANASAAKISSGAVQHDRPSYIAQALRARSGSATSAATCNSGRASPAVGQVMGRSTTPQHEHSPAPASGSGSSTPRPRDHLNWCRCTSRAWQAVVSCVWCLGQFRDFESGGYLCFCREHELDARVVDPERLSPGRDKGPGALPRRPRARLPVASHQHRQSRAAAGETAPEWRLVGPICGGGRAQDRL